MMTEQFDAIVLGAGQGGGPLAGAFAQAGRRTLLIEQAHAGGTCVNIGCTPTKTMVASARIAALTARASEYGVQTGPVHVQLAAVHRRTQSIVESFRRGSERGLAANGVQLCLGHGCFTAPRRLVVRDTAGVPFREVTADLVVISTGLRPARPAIPGLDDVPALDSTSLLALTELPAHLMILGGGYVGLEFAQMFRRFGSAVSVVDVAPRLLPREDPEIAACMTDILRADGIDLYSGAQARRVSRAPDGTIELAVGIGTAEPDVAIRGSHLLLAAGRRPDTEALGLALAGVATDAHGFIRTDSALATSASGVYAIGDVKGGPAFTHVAYDDYRILRDRLLHAGTRTTTDRVVPYTMFTDPPLGRIGLTETEARMHGRRIKVASMPMTHVARAIEMAETRGLMKVVVDEESGQLLGAAILGVEGGELAVVLQVAMAGRLPYTALRDMIFPHPTLAESLNNLCALLD